MSLKPLTDHYAFQSLTRLLLLLPLHVQEGQQAPGFRQHDWDRQLLAGVIFVSARE
jgi:hypothetical protein